MEVCKSGTPCFSCQSLLLSTTVLNDNAETLIHLTYKVTLYGRSHKNLTFCIVPITAGHAHKIRNHR